MATTRREFIGHLGLGAATVATLGTATLGMSGCNVWTDLESWIPVGISAVNGILSILEMNGIVIAAPIQLIVNTIQAAFTALEAAVKEYQSTTPPPVGVLQKIETIFQDIVSNFGTFLTQLGLSGGILSVISSLVQIILSTIAGFMNELPSASTRTLVAHATLKTGSATVPVLPHKRTRRAFKKSFNGTLDSASSVGVSVPPAAYLPVSFFEKF
jgi:hypothetical protein